MRQSRLEMGAFSYYRRLARVRHRVLTDLSNPPSASEAAEIAALSMPYFCRFFKAKTGINYSSWLRGVRIARATRLLVESNASILEVAQAVGYESPRSFQRAFKQEVGTTPTAFRSKLSPRQLARPHHGPRASQRETQETLRRARRAVIPTGQRREHE